MSVTINISRAKVYAIAEGISVTISQHNGGTPTYEQLWASQDEARKLDIWYREAISDLERRLMKWAVATSSQFDLSQNGVDYALQLTLSRFWPSRLEGLLDNKIQDYLVHSVTAGWLNDFDGLTVNHDYQAMASQDVNDIIDIICMQDFEFSEVSRKSDANQKDPSSIDADTRQSDTSQKDPSSIDADTRQSDERKNTPDLVLEAGYRRKDKVVKSGEDDRPPMARDNNARHKDDAVVDTRGSYTDMSGTDFGYSIEDPKGEIYHREPTPPLTRPMMGMGFTPQPKHPPVPEPPASKPSMEPGQYEEPPVFAVSPKFAVPPIYHSNGQDWSDMDGYDQESEEAFINSHVCGQHNMAADEDMFEPITEETPEETEEQNNIES